MNDQSPMPFGAHKGAKMENVPAKYLLWLWDKEDGVWRETGTELHKYIKDNLSALQKEYPDHILKHKP